MDLTTTDFIAAFLLAGQLQHCRRHRTIKAILHPKPPFQNHNSSQQPGSSEDAASSRESPTTDGLHGSMRASCSSGYDSIEPGVRMPPVRQRRPTLEGRSTDFEGAVKRVKLCKTHFVWRFGSSVHAFAVVGTAVLADRQIEIFR